MELQLRLALPTMLNLNSEQSDASTGLYTTRRSNNRRSTDEDFTDQSDTASTSHDCPNSVSLPFPVKCRRKIQDAGAGGMLVKAQIEGVVITRKIDLTLHQSYHTLISSILFIFGRGKENRDMYKLSYQDMEGDWLLADDVPWRLFVESVRRIKLLKNED